MNLSVRTLIALALSSSALAGCASMAPEHVRPEAATAPAFDPEYRPDGEVVASQLSYREWFADPRLVQLIGSALENNRDLLAATARIEQARARYRIQDSRQLPTVVADASGTRTRQPLGVNPSLDAGDVEGASDAVTFNRFDVGVGVSAFELDFWGRVASLSDAARAEYLATVAAQRAFYLSLIADTANTYYEIVETEEQIALAEATADSRREGLRIAKLRLDNGVTSALPYRQAETLLTQAEQQLASERLALAQLRNQLAVLVGGRVPDGLPSGLTLAAQGDKRRLAAGLPSDLLLVRPDIIGAEEQLRAARANIGAARAAFFPTISLTGNAGFSSNSLDGLFSGDGLGWSFGPSISLPIFDWGAREADLDLAQALEVEQVANYDRTVQGAFREVSDALAGRRWLAEQVETLERAVEAQERIARIARLRYREGVADYLEVLDAERNLFSARQQLLATQRAWLQNRATLFVALGGGAAE
ncbi:efflux transporter outer membrane subunit [Alteriqipengyuania lutimaris]|uniref:RND transporter n=1 Tax=Alteriqipengyuania lutimaris TaxID=1538146 RepID=A0A395LK00_9SPHN|nr:efflux transporter outer membrane subunit [Alteriqipengyuania lutimaris]MBB3033716.1 multidrug efflux system outer membrane protein [Alteriqipengyuania lutimaris]RDS77298.1 RND transporter [Alteriqipengyuania lutimaris]